VNPGMVVRGAAPIALAAFLLVACGDDGADGGTALGDTTPEPAAGAPTSLTVEAHDIAFDRDAYRVAAGPADIEYVQEGTLPHTLVIEASDGGAVDGFKLEVDGDDTDTGTVDLPAGDYRIYCDVPGHRDAGMEAELHVD
jgi:plastocyanin